MITNLTRRIILAEEVLAAETFSEKAKGLSGAEKPSALFFKTRWGIHTFGMKFPIDCVIFDDNFRVRALAENLRPDRFFFWNPKYKGVLELPTGVISKTGTKIGDMLEFKL